MVDITSDEYLDNGVARTAGTAYNPTGGNLTIRTDTRVHADAPASMTGCIAGMSADTSLGGDFIIDGTAVRWMAYDTGSGNVPAIGVSITQGGVSGYLLGVWANLTSAPTAVGVAMPTTGFIKFREVTSGPFTTGALTGIGASATAADVAGWIEIVSTQSVFFSSGKFNNFTINGDWFYLDNTTGAAGQILQVPTNGGGSGTEAPGCWVETGVATGLYEYWPAVHSGEWLAANIGTDIRCKLVENMGGGQMRIGNNGTTAMGFLPASGLRVRIPNVFGRQTSAANYTLNLSPPASLTVRPEFNVGSAGSITIEYLYCDWFMTFSAGHSQVIIRHTAAFEQLNLNNSLAAFTLEDVGIGGSSGHLNTYPFYCKGNSNGGTITDCSFIRMGLTQNFSSSCVYQSNVDLTLTNVTAGQLAYGTSRNGYYAHDIQECVNMVLTDCHVINCGILLAGSQSCVINDLDYSDRFVGTTPTANPYYAVSIQDGCVDCMVDGLTFGYNGVVANAQCYREIVYVTATTRTKIRNIGTKGSPLSPGTVNLCAGVVLEQGYNSGLTVNRCFMDGSRTNVLNVTSASTNSTFSDVQGNQSLDFFPATPNSVFRGITGNLRSYGGSGADGTHYWDSFSSDTAGVIALQGNAPTVASAAYVTESFADGSGFNGGGRLIMLTAGDYCIIEMSYFAKHHTAFQNVALVVNAGGAANHDFDYQSDTGSGWDGTWKTANGTNLSAETITPSIGIKLKFRITCNTSAPYNLINNIGVLTTSTLAAQSADFYPLDLTTITFTGIPTGAEWRLYEDDLTAGVIGSVELAGAEVHGGGNVSYTYEYGVDTDVVLQVMADGYKEYLLNLTLDGTVRSYPALLTVETNG